MRTALIDNVISSFKGIFHGSPEYMVRTPGRVNLIGEHTDYNMGFVLPMAINRNVWIAFRKREDQTIRIHSLDFNETIRFSSNNPEKHANQWSDYILGTVWALKQEGLLSSGWEGVISGDIPIGAGLSSSAATEIAIAFACTVASDRDWDPILMARIGQNTERGWLGVQSGIMDQMVVANARKGHALLLDCLSLEMEQIPMEADLSVAVMDTTSRRGLVNSPYTIRVEECHHAAELLGLSSLRDLDEKGLEENRNSLDEVLFRRCRHVVTENKRVHQAVAALKANQVFKLGRLLTESHASLRDDYQVSGKTQDQIVEIANRTPGCLGARMTGAGFGGCAVALVMKSTEDEFASTVSRQFNQVTGLNPEIFFSAPGAGASRELV
ncbi:MAG: galactokinase [Anaerolineales bacterium]